MGWARFASAVSEHERDRGQHQLKAVQGSREDIDQFDFDNTEKQCRGREWRPVQGEVDIPAASALILRGPVLYVLALSSD